MHKSVNSPKGTGGAGRSRGNLAPMIIDSLDYRTRLVLYDLPGMVSVPYVAYVQ
jgi:hypothetical protein